MMTVILLLIVHLFGWGWTEGKDPYFSPLWSGVDVITPVIQCSEAGPVDGHSVPTSVLWGGSVIHYQLSRAKDGRLPVFGRLPGDEALFGVRVPCVYCGETRVESHAVRAQMPWIGNLLSLPFSLDHPEVRLHPVQDPLGFRTYKGEVLLRSHPNRGNENLVLSSVTSGCPIGQDFDLPIAVTNVPLRLGFTWDPHSRIDPDHVRISFSARDGYTLGVPMRCEETTSLIAVTPISIDVGPETARGVVRIRSLALLVGDAQIDSPPCVIVSVARSGPREVDLNVMESTRGASLHRCKPLVVTISLEGDAMPFERAVRIEHLSPVFRNGMPELSGRFMPSENVYVTINSEKRYGLALPGRVPNVKSMVLGTGVEIAASVQVPKTPGFFELVVEAEDESVLLSGIVDSTLTRSLGSWSSL